MASNNNRKRRLTLRNPFVSEMIGSPGLGKQQDKGWGVMRVIWNSIFKKSKTIDDLKNDYGLFRALYHGTNNGDTTVPDNSIFLGSGFVKPIINSTLAFALGLRFAIKVTGADENESLAAIEEDLNNQVEREFAKLYDWLKWGTRDGDGFIYIDEKGDITHLKADTVDVVNDAITGRVVGYNVTEHVTIKDPTTGVDTKYVYLKQYRESYTRITRMLDNETQDQGTVIYYKVFINGEDIDALQLDENKEPIKIEAYADEIDQRRLPIIHYKNEPESASVYGNSEVQNILAFIIKYGRVLDSATDRELYNGTPVLAMYGVGKPAELDPGNANNVTTSDDGEKTLDWQQNTTLYLNDPQAKAEFLDIPATMENTGKLLEYYFYNIVQASETPEFVFGVAVSSSKASVSEQAPVVVQKAARKRLQMTAPLLEYLNVYISRQLENSNPLYFALRDVKETDMKLDFPSLVDEDKNLTKETIEMLLQEGAITRKTAIELSAIAEGVEDAEAEARAGLEDLNARSNAQDVLPEPEDRLSNELNLDDNEE